MADAQLADDSSKVAANFLLKRLRHADPQKPYAAALYSEEEQQIVVGRVNRERKRRSDGEWQTVNPVAHAEADLIRAPEARRLISAGKGQWKNRLRLYVSTRPCPMCTATILEAEIFEVRFFYENDWGTTVAGALVEFKESKLKEKPASLHYSFLFEKSRWECVFWALAKRKCADMAKAIDYALRNEGKLDLSLLERLTADETREYNAIAARCETIRSLEKGFSNPK